MTLVIDDTKERTRLTIVKGKKKVLVKHGSIKSLLRFVFTNTSKEKVKQSISELQQIYPLMIGSRTKIDIKD